MMPFTHISKGRLVSLPSYFASSSGDSIIGSFLLMVTYSPTTKRSKCGMVTTQGPAVRADTVTNRKAKSLDLIKVGGLVADTSGCTKCNAIRKSQPRDSRSSLALSVMDAFMKERARWGCVTGRTAKEAQMQ